MHVQDLHLVDGLLLEELAVTHEALGYRPMRPQAYWIECVHLHCSQSSDSQYERMHYPSVSFEPPGVFRARSIQGKLVICSSSNAVWVDVEL